ncbi:MAG: phosphate ABC transporter substrate-binding protein PstS [Rhodocyclaceae bacterium]|nr:phosphate ABC transporter substrate-binding protein PstS [Rhodocyclaceae bacterium]MCA3026164.1 phosphate ABC transporter substrate-binding protein PstS [Rhodocyclaceae bacterium]MCA3032738.1 phosphate ABC transporter substrate-binding protein PstS [Rhodocyclaceae bacterium]MCA3038807.1 phosphate ABC transporter substrate-binding protein PstS [Rhodocyclaceae bacterium]MCA3045535.1 phosphate ABC transporter substrate-binding protein PstS [Rhodocyclaceae bacterium]
MKLKTILTGSIAAVSMTFASIASAVDITGAGATFPFPIYAKWAEDYKKVTNFNMNYQSIGSGAGIRQIQAKTVDFGASDMPLKKEQLDKDGLIQFPAVIGGVVPVVNLEGIAPGQLRFTGPVLADIYLGKIKVWNDPAIVTLNPGVKLPGDAITVVRRSDGSGTTFLWVDYLSKVSPEWKTKVGVGTAVSWPEGVGGKGNEGVSAYVQRIKGSIGYVEYAYAKKNKMSHAAVRNRDGNFVQPDDKTFQAAAAGADWAKAPGMEIVLTDQAGKDAYPITGASFIMMHKSQANAEKGLAVMKFFDWAFANGDKAALELEYVPMPDSVVALIRNLWKAEVKGPNGQALWK